jgi:hypothetical protein
MSHNVVRNFEVREDDRVVNVKIIETDDPQYPSGFRYALHWGYIDGRGTILRYDNENETTGRHERHDENGVTEIDFPGMETLWNQFRRECEDL